LICAEVDTGAQWLGISGLSKPGVSQSNDYERSCGTSLYLEAMACGAGFVLVLGDEPLQSSFFQTNTGDLAIVRWVYVEVHADVEKFLKGPVIGGDLVSATHFEVARGPLILFDSALRGEDALANSPRADVQAGSYRVTTEKWQVDRTFGTGSV
jgi:hypothetical protein